MENMYFVYRHIRLDKNEPFYIGIGTSQGNCISSHYQRAYATRNRSNWWKSIVNKTNYEVEIIFESDNYDIIKEKEKEFILLYKDTLCNLTEGGDSAPGFCLRKVFQYSLAGEFVKEYGSAAEAARENNISTSALNRCLLGERKTNNLNNFQWFYDYRGNQILSVKSGRASTKKMVRLYNDTEEFIFNSRKECADFIKRSSGRVTDLIKIGTFENYKIENYED